MSDEAGITAPENDTTMPPPAAGDSTDNQDPRDHEIERLRAETERLRSDYERATETISRFVQQPPQQRQDLPPTQPDFSDADEVGLTPAQVKYLYGKVGASIAPAIERLTPKPRSADEVFDEVMERAGLNTEDNNSRRIAIGVTVEGARVLRKEGIDPTSPQGIARLAKDVRRELGIQPAAAARQPQRTAGVGGASLPPGQKPKAADKPAPTLCETMRARQKKFRLY